MPMREQPDGVRRAPRGDVRPAAAYDIFLDGEHVGWVERLRPNRQASAWRAYLDSGQWSGRFNQPGGYLAAVDWMLSEHRAAKDRNEPVTATEGAVVKVLSPVAADPFRGDPFADPLA